MFFFILSSQVCVFKRTSDSTWQLDGRACVCSLTRLGFNSLLLLFCLVDFFHYCRYTSSLMYKCLPGRRKWWDYVNE